MDSADKNTSPDDSVTPVYAEPPNARSIRFKYIAGGILILIFGLAGGLYFSRNLSKAPNTKSEQITPLPSPTVSPQAISPIVKSDEMAGWKTYVNEEYGFSFSYPPDMNLIKNQNSWEGIGLLLYNETAQTMPVIYVQETSHWD